MEHEAQHVTGWVLETRHVWIFLGVWVVVMLGYGIWRSLGKAEQDPIRPSGPGV